MLLMIVRVMVLHWNVEMMGIFGISERRELSILSLVRHMGRMILLRIFMDDDD
jgi:hypothetical protein